MYLARISRPAEVGIRIRRAASCPLRPLDFPVTCLCPETFIPRKFTNDRAPAGPRPHALKSIRPFARFALACPICTLT